MSNRSNRNIFKHLESNVQLYARAFPRVFKTAMGVQLHDVQGHRYLDFLGGAGTLNYGHNNPVLKRALIKHIMSDGITFSLDLHTEAKQHFLQAMEDYILKPRNLDYVVQFTGPTGSNAVEAALNLARKATGRTNVISFTNGFQGASTSTPLQGVTVLPYDGYLGKDLNTIDYLEKLLSDPTSGIDEPAAVIVETVQSEGGYIVASSEWLQKLQTLCRKRKIVLIVDDINTGCGRTGEFFSFEAAGLKPDIVTLSKSLSGYGLPLAVVLIKRTLDQWRPGEHKGSFRGNNHAFVTATAMLRTYWISDDFAQSVKLKGEQLRSRLEEIVARFSSHISKVSGRGMMQSLCFNDPIRAAAVSNRAFERGLLIDRGGSTQQVLKFMMPLTISFVELKEGLAILERSCYEEFVSIEDSDYLEINKSDKELTKYADPVVTSIFTNDGATPRSPDSLK